VVQLLAVPLFSFAQFFQGLYDNDSTEDWGWCTKNIADSNYFILGWSYNEITGQYSIFNMATNTDGTTIISKKDIKGNSLNIGPGLPGEMKELANGGCIIPIYVQWQNGTYINSAGGIIKFNLNGDTIFLKTYTDTSIYYDYINCIAVMPDLGYTIGGERGRNFPYNYPGLLIRTDSSGDTLWVRTYQHDVLQWVAINNIIPLNDGRIVLGAMSTYMADAGGIHHIAYYHNTPWFLVLDSSGNILKDTLYGSGYLVGSNVCNNLYKDKSGGYIHIGAFDSLQTQYPSDIENFPTYIAHLDTNFRITWITEFPYSEFYGHQQGVTIRQLQDSSYMVVGETAILQAPYTMGFAAKVSRNGDIIWHRNYYSDTTQWAYFRDVIERPNGSLVFVGSTFNDTLPVWHQGRDVWLLSVDSNGCEIEGCNQNTAVKNIIKPTGSLFSVFPNPTTGEFTLKSPQSGTVIIYNMQGQQVMENKVMAGATNLRLPSGVGAGVYMVKYEGEGNNVPVVLRLVYEP